jgi:hypothetical protein
MFRGPDGKVYVVTPDGRFLPVEQPKPPSLKDVAINIGKGNLEEEAIGAISGAFGGSQAAGAATAATQSMLGGNAAIAAEAAGLYTPASAELALAGYNAPGMAASAASEGLGGAGVTGLGAAGIGAAAALSMPALYYSGLGKKIGGALFGGSNRQKNPARKYVAEEVAAENDFGKSFEGFDNLTPEKKLEFVKRARELGTNFITPGVMEQNEKGEFVTKESSKKQKSSLFDLHHTYGAMRRGNDQQDNAYRFGGTTPEDFTIDKALADPRLGGNVRKRLMGLKDLYAQIQGTMGEGAPVTQEQVTQGPRIAAPVGREGPIRDLMYLTGRDGPAPEMIADLGRNPFQNNTKPNLQSLSQYFQPIKTQDGKGINVNATLNKGKKKNG